VPLFCSMPFLAIGIEPMSCICYKPFVNYGTVLNGTNRILSGLTVLKREGKVSMPLRNEFESRRNYGC